MQYIKPIYNKITSVASSELSEKDMKKAIPFTTGTQNKIFKNKFNQRFEWFDFYNKNIKH